MARLATVALIGRPNTGKSTLFNRLTGGKRAIVSDVPGTTRDHIAMQVDLPKISFLLVDTGGLGGGSQDHDLEEDVSMQSMVAIERADLIIFTIDSREELTASDQTVIDMLRKKKKRHVPVVLVLTKCDNNFDAEELSMQYIGLGVADMVLPISAVHNTGILELEDAIAHSLLELHFQKAEQEHEGMPKVTMVGKPNVGKSSLINALMSDPQREKHARIVSDIPGTTRDTTDVVIRHEDSSYLFIDTAGIKRHAISDRGIEYYAMLRSIQAMSQADVVLLTLDANQEISRQDKRLANLAIEAGKGMIILFNKADLLSKSVREEKMMELRAQMPFCTFAPVLFVSAMSRESLPKIFTFIQMVHESRVRRVPTKELHNWYNQCLERLPAKSLVSGKHITQAKDVPPTFVLFVKNPKNVQKSQLKFLERSLRETFGFDGTPIRMITKGGENR